MRLFRAPILLLIDQVSPHVWPFLLFPDGNFWRGIPFPLFHLSSPVKKMFSVLFSPKFVLPELFRGCTPFCRAGFYVNCSS